jgi:aminotransferase
MFERTQNLRLSVIKQMELRASKFPDVISLAQGVPSFDTPECIKRRVERALRDGVVARYSLSPGLPELRELIEIHLARENMIYDWQKEIIVTAGSIEGITATILAITNPGDEIIIPEPTYTSYREVIMLAGCTPVFVPLNEEKGWAFELEKYEAAITPKTKAIFYCNPNNPTGTIYTKEQLLGLASLAEKYNLYLISDEVYKDLVFDNPGDCHPGLDPGSSAGPEASTLDSRFPASPAGRRGNDKMSKIFSLAEIPRLRKRVIRLFSFSKTYAMTGWRIGYLHSDQSIVKEILKVHDSLVTCAPVISQYAAMGALEMAADDVKQFNRKYKTRRDLICNRLDRLKNVFSYVKPTSSYYVFPKIINNNIKLENQEFLESLSWRMALELLEKAQVAVVPGVAFGANGENHIRISFGKTSKEISGAFDRVEKLFVK